MARKDNDQQATLDADLFDGREIQAVAIRVTNAGDGLSQSMTITPQILHLGQKVTVVMDGTVSKIGYVGIKDTDLVRQEFTLKAGAGMLIDRTIVAKILDEQAIAIEQAAGVERLPGVET